MGIPRMELGKRCCKENLNYVAKSNPDGYNILLITVANAINPSLTLNLPFDIEKDFLPVILAGFASNVLVVHPSLPVNSIQELVALAKAKPGKLTYGSSGTGTSPHLAAELFKRNLGMRIDHILLSKNLLTFLKKAYIDKTTRSLERPSDHVPVVIALNLNP